MAIKAACNGRYLTSRMNGSLFATADEPGDKEKFIITLLNKPRLVLKCDFGYVGLKSAKYECNRTAFDAIELKHQSGKQGCYHLLSE